MIRNIFLDAGYTLVYPKAHSWFYPTDFFDYCPQDLFLEIEKSEKYKELYLEGYKFLDENHLLKDENDECEVFAGFYKIILTAFPELEIGEDKIKKIAESIVFNYDKFNLYGDVKIMLDKWKSDDYKLGIISDTWPSLVGCFKNLGIYDYFDVFVMSCDYGVWKPHEKMYLSALGPLNARGEESVFIDDYIENLDGASKFSINPVQIARKGNSFSGEFNKSKEEKYPKFENLPEIDGYISNIS
ncbi:MAG: HAD-IA family hydrolase [Oscillospiraceae bacterium]|nr:HAD-IA family hydrolase [Oscillospiraceae bacterium]